MENVEKNGASEKIKKGYKQTEVGIIPNDWEVRKLGEIGTFKKGRGIKKDAVLLDGLPCIRYGEIYTHHNEYIKKFNSFISIETARESQKIKQGDLLFAGSGETAEEIGKCVAYLDRKEVFAGGDIIILSPFEDDYDSKYLGFLFNNGVIVKQKSQMAQGDAVVHIYSSNLAKIFSPLPPTKAEQTAIAEALSDADALISRLEELIAKKRNIKQGAMQELLTGKKRLPGFSGEWEVKKLGDIAEYRNGKSYENCIVEDGDYLLITLDSIDIRGKLKSEHKKISINDNSLLKGDLIMILSDVAHGYFLGLTDVIPESNKYVLNQRVGVLKNLKGILPYFLSKYINTNQRYFKLTGQGSSQQNLAKDDILNFSVSVPPITEQTAIAQVLSDMDAEIEQLEQKLDKYRAIKQGMMQELLTGKIRLNCDFG